MRLVLIIHESVCGNPASALKNFLVFAEVLQAPISPFWRLQKFCKLHFSLLGICRSSASSIFPFWVFAEVLQAPFFSFGHLQEFCKLHFSLWGLCRNAANVFGSLTRGFTPPSAARRNTRSGRSRAPSAGCVARAAVAPSGAARRAWRRPRQRPRCRSRAG